jgi:hypothetical protein
MAIKESEEWLGEDEAVGLGGVADGDECRRRAL